MNNLHYLDEALLLQSGFKYGLTFQTLWKQGTDKKQYCCHIPHMHWHVLTTEGKGLSVPYSEDRLMSRDSFKELFE